MTGQGGRRGHPVPGRGVAWDRDHLGGLPLDDIVDFEWTDTFNGVVTVIDDGNGNPKNLTIPAADLPLGWHQITFKALDGEGNWSNGSTVNIVVVEKRYDAALPMLIR